MARLPFYFAIPCFLQDLKTRIGYAGFEKEGSAFHLRSTS